MYLKTANAYTKTEDALFYTGLSYGFLKNADSAFVFLDECVKKNPKYPRINYFKGLILSDVADVTLDSSMRNKILVKSLIYFDKAILENPKDWETHVQSGYCYGKMNNFKKAIPALIKGTSLNPKNFQALLFIGIGFGMQQKSDSALIYFEKAKQIEPTNVEVYKNIAITFKTKNNYKKALESIKEGLIYQPSNEILIQLQNEILAIQNSVK